VNVTALIARLYQFILALIDGVYLFLLKVYPTLLVYVVDLNCTLVTFCSFTVLILFDLSEYRFNVRLLYSLLQSFAVTEVFSALSLNAAGNSIASCPWTGQFFFAQ